MRALKVALLALLVTGCAFESKVTRVYGGKVVEGPFVPPEAYATYLRGVLAEEAGDLKSALAAYEQAAHEDDEDPEPLTRIADMRCRLDPRDHVADDALSQALALDRSYAPALAVQARCAAARGRPQDGLAMLARIPVGDRTTTSLEALTLKLAGETTGPTRERAIALTLASGEHVAAWDALIAWGRAKSDGEMIARGFEGLVDVAPMRSQDAEAGALELLGAGHTALARRVAAHIADVSTDRGVSRVQDPTVARLAIDDAILAGNREQAERRAVRGHVSLSEVAARAVVLERQELASSLAQDTLQADPKSTCASMVLSTLAARRAGSRAKPPSEKSAAAGKPPGEKSGAAASEKSASAAQNGASAPGEKNASAAQNGASAPGEKNASAAQNGASARGEKNASAAQNGASAPSEKSVAAKPNAAAKPSALAKPGALARPGENSTPVASGGPAAAAADDVERVPAVCLLPLAERVAVVEGSDVARAWAARVGAAPIQPHDPVVGPLVVDLAARGVISEKGLPFELRLELAARRREAPPPMEATARKDVDAKHMLLWHALLDPGGSQAKALLAKMQNASDRDVIIGFALGRVALASGLTSSAQSAIQRAIAAAPAHPLLLALAVEVAKQAGRGEDTQPVRTRLMAVARTPAERALANDGR